MKMRYQILLVVLTTILAVGILGLAIGVQIWPYLSSQSPKVHADCGETARDLGFDVANTPVIYVREMANINGLWYELETPRGIRMVIRHYDSKIGQRVIFPDGWIGHPEDPIVLSKGWYTLRGYDTPALVSGFVPRLLTKDLIFAVKFEIPACGQ